MKNVICTVLLFTLMFSATAFAAEPGRLIPPYHWSYHDLETLANRGLINETITPGKTALTAEQVVGYVIFALNRVEANPRKLGEEELASLRQLINGFDKDFERLGFRVLRLKTDLENCAAAAGIPQHGTSEPGTFGVPLSARAATAVNDFSFRLFNEVGKGERGNIFLSPYSVSSALALAYAGARGATESEMDYVLRFNPDIHRSMSALIREINNVPAETAVIRTANAIWPSKEEKLLVDYVSTVEEFYHATIQPQNYKTSSERARRTINQWVAKNTEGKITDIIADGVLNRDTAMVLTNAIYFKSEWLEKFTSNNTHVMPFWVSPIQSVGTTMMNRTGEAIRHGAFGEADMVELPYQNERFSMLVILPEQGKHIADIEKKLDNVLLSEWLGKMEPKRVELTIPKFKTESAYSLSSALEALGMKTAFDAGNADFSGINGDFNLFISEVAHKTFIDVAEEGTEAAAATAVIMTRTSMPMPQETVIFKADRPFIYLIRDNPSGAILFIGRYAKP